MLGEVEMELLGARTELASSAASDELARLASRGAQARQSKRRSTKAKRLLEELRGRESHQQSPCPIKRAHALSTGLSSGPRATGVATYKLLEDVKHDGEDGQADNKCRHLDGEGQVENPSGNVLHLDL